MRFIAHSAFYRQPRARMRDAYAAQVSRSFSDLAEFHHEPPDLGSKTAKLFILGEFYKPIIRNR